MEGHVQKTVFVYVHQAGLEAGAKQVKLSIDLHCLFFVKFCCFCCFVICSVK